MRIDRTGISPLTRSPDHTASVRKQDGAPAAAMGAVDDVQLSARARLLAIAREALAQTPSVRRSVVEAARARLQAGQYHTDGRSIAEALLATIKEGL